MNELEFKAMIGFKTEVIRLAFTQSVIQETYSHEAYKELKENIFDVIIEIKEYPTTWTNFFFKFRAKRKLQSLFLEIFEEPYLQ